MQTRNTTIPKLLCVVVGLALVGVGPASADELPADGGPDECDRRYAEAYAEIDAFEATVPGNGLVTEVQRLRTVQTIISEANFDVSLMDCGAGP